MPQFSVKLFWQGDFRGFLFSSIMHDKMKVWQEFQMKTFYLMHNLIIF